MHINIPATERDRIIIVGAGFAGLQLARQLARSSYQVVLLDKNNFHQFQPLFYQVAMAGLEPSSIVFPLRKVFQKHANVFFRMTSVERVDTAAQRIYTPMGDLHYDHLVLAMGADTNFFGNEEIQRHAIPMKSVAEALYLRNRILNDFERALSVPDYEERQGLIDIVIVGGGPTGVEVAGALAEMKKYILPREYKELDSKEIDIYLIQGADCLLKGMSAESSAASERFLQELGVIVKKDTRVVAYDGKYVEMHDGSKIRSNKVIWAAGIQANKLVGLPESVITYGRRLQVNRLNQVEGFSCIYAIGDLAYMEEEAFPQGHPQVAQVAIQQAENLARNLTKKRQNPQPFSYQDLGSMATIGRNRAVVDLKRLKFQGFFAWVVWLVVHLFALIGVKNKIFVFINWVWNYITYDQSLRLIIRPFQRQQEWKEAEKP
ncbi:MAG: NAD(P)/FAD-dependent oxidoreductase [Bacteroidota bacterium]